MNKLNTIELFSGTGSFSNVAHDLGHNTFTVDIDSSFSPDLCGNILDYEIQEKIKIMLGSADVVWMSPDCTTWSLSAGNTYWTEFRQPRNSKAIDGIKMMLFCRYVADYCVKHNKIFFIENPNGRAIWILDNKYLKRIWYCQYGDTRAKPTNIWTNLKRWSGKQCKNNSKICNHERAPRGSKTGTQGLKNATKRGAIPPQLFYEIFGVINDNNQ